MRRSYERPGSGYPAKNVTAIGVAVALFASGCGSGTPPPTEQSIATTASATPSKPPSSRPTTKAPATREAPSPSPTPIDLSTIPVVEIGDDIRENYYNLIRRVDEIPMPEYVFLAGESEGDVTGSMEITEDQTRIIMRANDPNGLSYEWIVINTGEAVDEGHGYYLNVGVIYTVNLPRGAGKVVTVSEGPALGNYLPDAQASWDEAVSASNAILERAANYFPGGVDRLGETKAPDDPVAFRPSVFFGGSPVINSVPKHPTKVFITKDGNTTGIDIVSRPDWNADRVLDNLITMSPMSAAQVAEAAEEKGLTLPTSGVEYPYDDVTFYKHMKAIIDQLTPEVQ